MRILKPGKVEQRKFVCPWCKCEFLASLNEIEYDPRTGEYETICPNIECGEHIKTMTAEAYEEPTPTQDAQTDAAKLYKLMKETWPYSTGALNALVTFLIANGVTFREE